MVFIVVYKQRNDKVPVDGHEQGLFAARIYGPFIDEETARDYRTEHLKSGRGLCWDFVEYLGLDPSVEDKR